MKSRPRTTDSADGRCQSLSECRRSFVNVQFASDLSAEVSDGMTLRRLV